MTTYREFHRRSIEDKEGFWAEQAKLVHWERPPGKCSTTAGRPSPNGSSEEKPTCATTRSTGTSVRAGTRRRSSIFPRRRARSGPSATASSTSKCQRAAAMMRSLGSAKGDRVIVYMPMIPEAVFVVLACARIGAIHSVVFGGFAAASLAARIDDARPKLMVTADGGSRMGKVVTYKALVDESIRLAKHPPARSSFSGAGWINRFRSLPGAIWITPSCARSTWTRRCRSPGSNRTSRPTSCIRRARPACPRRAARRRGYAVALAASMKHIYCGGAGRRCSPPRTSAGWWDIPTSSTRR